MIVLNPENTNHTITIVPRYYPESASLTCKLYNEATKVETSQSVSQTVSNGNLSFGLTFTFSESDKYQIAIYDANEVVFRGKIFATEQESQTFKLTQDKYYYE